MERTVIDRLREYAGKDRNQVVNPNITAGEAIQIADYLVLLEGFKHVAEVFLENVDEVTELLLALGPADNIVALCDDLMKLADTTEGLFAKQGAKQ